MCVCGHSRIIYIFFTVCREQRQEEPRSFPLTGSRSRANLHLKEPVRAVIFDAAHDEGADGPPAALAGSAVGSKWTQPVAKQPANEQRVGRKREEAGNFFFFIHGLTSGGNLVQQPRLVSACRCPGEMVAFKKKFKKIKVNCVCAEPVLRDVLAVATGSFSHRRSKRMFRFWTWTPAEVKFNSSVQIPKRREGFPSYLGVFTLF